MLRFRVYDLFPGGKIDAVFDDEPEPRKSLLSLFLSDMYGQEDVYLAELAKAEAGEATEIYNHYVVAYMYPDYVVLEDMRDPELEAGAEGPPRCTRLSLAETRQLIADWLDEKQRFRQQQKDAAAATESRA